MRRFHPACLPICLLLLGLAVCPPPAASADWEPGELIVKLRAEGPYAVEACAEKLTREGRSLAEASAAGSPSLERLHRDLRVQRVRALFRRPDGTPLAEQRRRWRERLLRAGARQASLPDLSHVYRIQMPASVDVPSAAARYRRDPHVVWAQPNYRVRALALDDGLPDDPFFSSEGSWDQPFEDLWGLHRIRVAGAWPLATGEGVVVGVNDTGLDYSHPDIADNVWINPGEDLNGNGVVDPGDLNGRDDDGNGYVDDLRGFDFYNSGEADDGQEVVDPDPFDDNGHGTHVAGTIAATGDNGIGVVGVAPRARIMALKALDESGSGDTADLARAIVYAAENGARVINNSWSCSSRCPENPVAEEAVRLAHALGVVLVFSAGNRADEVAFYSPQNMPETLTVAASLPDDTAAGFSNRGFTLDVSAPGAGFPFAPPSVQPSSGVLSLLSSAASASFQSRAVAGQYLRLAGTSMAAPHAAGVAALLLSQRPQLTPDEVGLLLRLSAQDVGRPGFDFRHGAGRLDALAALGLADVPRLQARIRTPGARETLRLRDETVEVRGTAAGDDLSLHQLFVGVGEDPEAWVPIGPARGDPVVDGVLGSWALADFDEGQHVLRLAVTGRGGQVVESFVAVALARNPAQALGDTGSEDRRPVVSDGLVVWESQHAESGEDEGWNLFAADLADPQAGFRAVVAGPGDASGASLSRGRLAWEGEEQRGWTCRIDAPAGCRPQPLGDGIARFPEVSGGRVVWSAVGSTGPLSVFACDVAPPRGVCDGREIASPATGPRFSPALDGDRFVWSEFRDLVTCSLDPAGACPTRSVARFIPGFVDLPAVSGNAIAWLEFTLDGRTRLRACLLDPETGACPIVEIPGSGGPGRPDVADNLVVWQDRAEGLDTEIFFCELERDGCQVQRLTSNFHPQFEPSTDGDWVVWADLRNGVSDIYGLELPQLEPLAARRVDEGEWLRVDVAGRDPLGDPVMLDASLVDGTPLAALGAVFEDLGDGRGRLRWRPGYEQAGHYAVRFRLTTVGGLHRSRTLELTVEDVNRPPQVELPLLHVARVGEPLRLDACGTVDPDGDALAFRWQDRNDVLGDGCALELPARDRPGLQRLVLEVDDGTDAIRRLLLALWRPVRGRPDP
jgi:beta propeller repeat protein